MRKDEMSVETVRIGKYALPSPVVFALAVFLVAPFFRPQIIEHVGCPELFELYVAWKAVAIVLIAILFLLFGKKSIFALAMTGLAVVTLVSTLVFDGRLMVWFDQFLSFWAASLLALTVGKFCLKEFLYALWTVSFGLLLMHFASILLYPDGIWASQYFFFGNRNGIFIMMLPALGSSFALDALSEKRCSLRSLTVVFVSLACLWLAPSVTSMFALGVILICCLSVQWRPPRRILNGFVYLGAYAVGVLLVVVVRVQDLLAWFLEDALHKSVTLSGRTPVWDAIFADRALQYFPIGHGAVDYGYITTNGMTLNAHDQLLHVWYVGGVAGLALFVMLLVLAMRNLYRFRMDKVAAVYAATLGAFFIIGITEAQPYCSFYFMLALAYCYSPKKLGLADCKRRRRDQMASDVSRHLAAR